MEVAAVGWGISIAGWIISPYITRLLDKVYSHIKPNHKSKANLDKLVTHVIPRLKLVMEAADGSTHKVLFESLVTGLKSAFRDTEDILDELEYIRHHNQATQRKKKRKHISPESGPSNKIPGPLNDKLQKNIKNIEFLIDEAWKTISIENEIRGSNLRSIIGSAEHEPIAINREKEGPTPTVTVTGRDDNRDRIMKMLEQDGNPNSVGTCLSVIGIHGIPGSGKTTLAQYIFQEEKTAGHFDLVMWIHVSEKFRVDTIFIEMIEQALGKNEKNQWSNNLVILENNLKELLTGKRFLLVLDDIWCSEKVSEHRKLQRLIPSLMAGNRGSKILVTSRHKDALSELGPDVSIIENSGIPELDDDDFLELLMHTAFGHRNRDVACYKTLLKIGAEIAKKLRKSPLLASVVGGMLYKKHDPDHWRRVAEQKILEKYMGPLWWCYQHLDEQAKRCFAYCSIFPRRRRLYRDELVNLWVAEGFISTTDEGWDMECVSQECFDELLSVSFLQSVGMDAWDKEYFVIHDLLHDLSEKVAGSDFFKIENALAKAPSDVRHLCIESCSASMITEDIIKLTDLRTLIIFDGEDLSSEVLDMMFMKLTKLRVLILQNIHTPDDDDESLPLPRSINYMKHLRYLCLQMDIDIVLPSTIGELYLLQVLHIGDVEYPKDSYSDNIDATGLTNLRHLIGDVHFSNIGSLTSLQTMTEFHVGFGAGHELHQLGDLYNLRGNLIISGLWAVNSKEEAIQAKLADKQYVTSLTLNWRHSGDNPENAADVFDGLCPPEGLQVMEIWEYHGSRYPEWMFGPEETKINMHTLILSWCGKLVPAPVPDFFFIRVASLELHDCDWDAMPFNMVHLTELLIEDARCDVMPANMVQLTSLRRLIIRYCKSFRQIPALPASLLYFKLAYCDEGFTNSCKEEGHPNYMAIQHIPEKNITLW